MMFYLPHRRLILPGDDDDFLAPGICSLMPRRGMMAAAGTGDLSLMGIIQGFGLTTDLKLVLDAGDAASYTSGQRWLDRSGNGFDFFRGADGNAAADDPTFNGSPGGVSSNEYWSFDGGDFFRYDSANETWMNNIHKENALFTIMLILRPQVSALQQGLFGTSRGSSVNVGVAWWIKTDEVLNFQVVDGVAPAALTVTTDNAVSGAAWHMLAISVDEAAGAGGGFLYKDGAFDQVVSADTFDATYSAPSTGGATFTMEIGTIADVNIPLVADTRLAGFAAWEGTALTKAQLDLFWDRIRGRFGI